jgi:hypothetical protein
VAGWGLPVPVLPLIAAGALIARSAFGALARDEPARP